MSDELICAVAYCVFIFVAILGGIGVYLGVGYLAINAGCDITTNNWLAVCVLHR